MTRAPIPASFAAADLYGDLEPAPTRRLRDVVPGLVVVALASLASAYIAEHYGAPLTLMALLVGLALNFLGADGRLTPGLAFAASTLLRVGIVLVGARITLAQVAALGPVALFAIVGIVAVTMGAAILLSRRFGFGAAFGALAGGAVAICGASAALAIATVLGERRAGQAQLTLVLVGISAMSAAAMVLYPALCHHLGFDDRQAGFVLGAAIHDVAQSLGAGYAFSTAAGQDAAIVKLTRVALLAPVLAVVGIAFPSDGDGRRRAIRVPWFVIGFFVLAAINSTGVIPPPVGAGAADVAAALLVGAVTATGIRSPMHSLLGSGGRPLVVIAVASAVALLLACLVAATLL